MKTTFIYILLAITLLTSGILLYQNLPGEIEKFKIDYNSPKISQNLSLPQEIQQFAPKMRFNHNNLTYQFLSGCNQKHKSDMKKAFQIIQDKVKIITFTETFKKADIKVTCSAESIQNTGNTMLAGEGGPTKFINTTIHPLILEGTIILYKPKYETKKCSEPIVELHELLHVFGFKHYDDENSIMYPYLKCDQKLNPEFIEYLKEIYSAESKAELHFKNLTAKKSGRYLSFTAVVENKGIIETNSTLVIISEEKQIETFNLKNLPPGSYKTLSVQNVRLPWRTTKKATFKIISEKQEYSTKNNKLDILIQ